MKISQHSPFANQQLKTATSYINSHVSRYGSDLNAKLDGQSGKPTILITNDNNQVVKRIGGAMVANKMSKGLYVVV